MDAPDAAAPDATVPPLETTPGPSTTPQTPIPVPAGGVVLHFSDCQVGAAAGCVAGDDANPGTEVAPKRDFRNVAFNDLPAGSQLRFKRGGSWNVPLTRLDNENVTPTAPLVFDAYDSGPAPLFRGSDFAAFEFGGYQNQNNDGGYYFRSIKLDGLGVSDWGFWLRDNLRNVTFDSIELTGFGIAIHVQQTAPHYITKTVLRNSVIRRNSAMGILGTMDGALIEGNVFEENNFSGSAFNHAIYLSSGNGNTLRNNRFIRNSTVNGVCTGGNVTIHGQVTGLTIEGNLIEQDAAEATCYGFSITPGYNTPEWFRNVVVRDNTVVNTGNCSVCAGAAPGILVENNLAINTMSGAYHIGVLVPTSPDQGAGDDLDTGAIVRDNIMCQATPHQFGAATMVTGANAQVNNNVLRTGADATTGPCVK